MRHNCARSARIDRRLFLSRLWALSGAVIAAPAVNFTTAHETLTNAEQTTGKTSRAGGGRLSYFDGPILHAVKTDG